MNVSQAREIIEALANGVNPTTGEVFDDDHCFNDPDIIRALFVATDELKKAEKKLSRKMPENMGKPWTDDLDAELKSMFLSGKSKKEMGSHFGRSSGAISSRLRKLELI